MRIHLKLLLILIAFAACSKSSTSYVNNPNAPDQLHNRSVGASANELLSSNTYKSLKIEIQYMTGFAPDAGAVGYLQTFLGSLVNKPSGISIVTKEIAASSSQALSVNDIINIELTKNQLPATRSLPEKTFKKTIKHKSIAVASSKPAKKQQRKPLPPEVLQVEKDYDELIAEQIKYTKSLALYGENVDYFQKFKNDFKTLENQEKELRKSIAQSGLKENSIDDLAMIYQQKLTVLKKLQNEINKTSNCNKNLTDTIPAYISL